MGNSNLENEEHSGINPELSNPVNIPANGPTPQENLEFSYLKDALLQTSVWAKRFNILNYIGIGFSCLMAVIALFTQPLSTFVFLIVIGIYIIPIIYLKNFIDKVNEGVFSNNTQEITDGVFNLMKYFKFIFISILVGFGLYIIIMILALVFFTTF